MTDPDPPDLSPAAVLALPAGWETDAILDHHVMGGVPPQFELLRDAYTVDARAACRLIDHLAARGVYLCVRRLPDRYAVDAFERVAEGQFEPLDDTEVEAPTLAHAVALTALLCVPHLRPA